MFQNKILKICKLFENGHFHSPKLIYPQKREIHFLLNWFISIFNGVDRDRLKLVGPDCACAEWLLRNGACVRFRGHLSLLSDYNELINLEETGTVHLKIEDIYANDASINRKGFEHLKNCNHVKKITFIFCLHLDNRAMFQLNYVKDTLQYLEIKSCHNIQDKGVKALGNLSNLNTLILNNLTSVENKADCEAVLRKALPKCKIEFLQ